MRLAAIAMALLAAGCVGAAPSGPSVQAQVDEKLADCRVQYPSKRGNNVPLARCVNEANALLRGHPDIGDALAKRRIAIATRMDAGQIGQEDGEAAIAQARAEANSERQRRRDSAATVRAIQAGPAPVTCHTTGSITNCY